jgi:hypothetical protein
MLALELSLRIVGVFVIVMDPQSVPPSEALRAHCASELARLPLASSRAPGPSGGCVLLQLLLFFNSPKRRLVRLLKALLLNLFHFNRPRCVALYMIS